MPSEGNTVPAPTGLTLVSKTNSFVQLDSSVMKDKKRSSFFNGLFYEKLNIPIIYNPIYHTNKGKSSLTSLVACKPVTVTLKN